jgi:hypothetical protein
MDRLFSPCTRLHRLIESQGLEEGREHNLMLLQELNLYVSTEEILSAERGFTFADLHATFRNRDTVAWLTPHASIVRAGGRAMRYWEQLDESCSFAFNVDGKKIDAVARSPEHLLEICDIVLRLLAASVVQSVCLNGWNSPGLVINAPAFEYMMEQCQSLKVLKLVHQEMDEDHCRVLGAYSRPDLEMVLDCCTITDAGASTLAEVLGRYQGPTKLDFCGIDNVVLANGLRGNSRLKILKLRFSANPEVGNPELLEIACALGENHLEHGNQEVLAIAGALKENKGLVGLKLLHDFRMSDGTWNAVYDSLKTHPTLEVLNLCTSGRDEVTIIPSLITSRMQAVVDMLKVNVSIHTVHLDHCLTQTSVYRESIVPYLETNRFRPRLLAKLSRRRTAPRCWDERFLQLVVTQIAFGCFYQGMPELPFRRRLRRPHRLPLLPLL